MDPDCAHIWRKPEIDEKTFGKWQRLVDLMARACRVPVGLIMRVDQPFIEVFVSSATGGNPYEKGERALLDTGLYCETVIRKRMPLLVPQALNDPEWDHNPDIRLGLTYYFGFPIAWPDGEIFGTLCILDNRDNEHASGERELIAEFCAVVERDLYIIAQSDEREGLLADLRREIAERVNVEEKLRDSLKEKELLLREVHHRTKNNLSLVAGMLYLASRKHDDPRVQEVFRDSENRINSIALVHEKLFDSPYIAAVDFGCYMTNIISDIFSSMGRNGITWNVTSDPVRLQVATAIPLALIANELVTNAIKYAFPSGREGHVAVNISIEGPESAVMIVQDNGIGFPEHLDHMKSPSLGLTIVQTLVQQIQGVITLHRENGTAFTVQFRPAAPG